MLPPVVRSPIVVLAILAAQVSASAAQPDGAGLFESLDADGNGQVAASEVGAEHRALFKRLLRTGDEDEDGKLTAEELSAALEPVRAEKPLVEKQGGRLPGGDALAVLLIKMDENRDGRIEALEVPREFQAAYDQLLRPGDGDKDGDLNAREIAQNAPRLGMVAQMAARRAGLDVDAEFAKIPAAQKSALDQTGGYGRPMDMMADPSQADQLFKRLDANGDKVLESGEADGPFAQRFEEMVRRGDANGDQKLDRREFLAMSRRLSEFESARPDAQAVRRAERQLLSRFDADGDGQLSVREAPPRMVENFDRADADANGRLDRGELSRVAEAMARMQSFAGGPEKGMRNARPDAAKDRRALRKAAKAKKE